MRLCAFLTVALFAVAALGAFAGDDTSTPKSIAVHVRVVTDDSEKRPVAGARVAVHDVHGDIAVGRTGPDGDATLDLGPPSDRLDSVAAEGSLVVEASGGGRGLCALPIKIRELKSAGLVCSATTDVELALRPGAPVVGRVLDAATGRPIAGARVAADQAIGGIGAQFFEPPHCGEVTTDATGAFRFEGVDLDGGSGLGTALLSVTAPRYGSAQRYVTLEAKPATEGHEFHLEPAGEIRGRVLDKDGGPLPRTWLELSSELVWSPDGDASWGHARYALTDRDGAFRLPWAAFGVRHVVRANIGNFWRELTQPRTLRGLQVTPEHAVAEVAFRVEDDAVDRPASLVVTVRTASALVAAAEVRGALRLPGDDWVIAWAEGSPLRYSGVLPGRYRLTVAAKNLPTWTGDVEVDAKSRPSSATVVIGGKETMEGRVVDDAGAPVPGAHVEWRTSEDGWTEGAAATGGDGALRIVGLLPGKYRLRASRDDRYPSAAVEAAAPAKDVRVVLPRTGAVRLRLQAPEGAALPDAVRWDGAHLDCVDGRVVLPAVPQGRQHLELEAFERPDHPYLPISFDLEVKPGAETDAGTITLDRGVSISGVVLAPGGRPAADALVQCGSAAERADADGRFTLQPVPKGPAELFAITDHAAARATIDASRSPVDVEIRLASARLIRVETARSPTAGRPEFFVRAVPRGVVAASSAWTEWRSRPGQVDARGVAFLMELPGDWTIQAVAADDDVIAALDVTVSAGGDEPFRVTLPIR